MTTKEWLDLLRRYKYDEETRRGNSPQLAAEVGVRYGSITRKIRQLRAKGMLK